MKPELLKFTLIFHATFTFIFQGMKFFKYKAFKILTRKKNSTEFQIYIKLAVEYTAA